ncbi:hypothetical protein ABND49_10320 [Paenibacillus larvae]
MFFHHNTGDQASLWLCNIQSRNEISAYDQTVTHVIFSSVKTKVNFSQS